MKHPPFAMSATVRRIVVETAKEVCGYRGWTLFAAHALRDHAHFVVRTETRPENAMHDLKAYTSRKLTKLSGAKRPYWSRHGSTLWLWNRYEVEDAIRYVMDGQPPGGVRYPSE